MKPKIKNRFKIFKMKPLGNTGILYRSDKDLSYFKLSVRISLEKFENKRKSKTITQGFFETLENIINH